MTLRLSYWERSLFSRGGRILGIKFGYYFRLGSVWGIFGLVGVV